jgi:hypothetical protein
MDVRRLSVAEQAGEVVPWQSFNRGLALRLRKPGMWAADRGGS